MNTPHKTPHRIDVATADALITAAMPEFPATRVLLDQAVGQILREPVRAERDQPPFDRATMDGYAINSAALATQTTQFRIVGTQAAGAPRQTVQAVDDCMEIMTGAVVPEGLDTVVPIERIDARDNQMRISSDYTVQAGQFVHRQASDHCEGDTLLEPGTLIRSPEMAILTAAGKADVAVGKWPSVAVISTGDELVDVGVPIADHQIRSSNDRGIAAALQLRGCRSVTRVRLPDDRTALLHEVRRLHDEQDVLILSGGVSMGKYDYIPGIMEELGVRLVLHKILQRPGLPMWFGISAAGVPVFALPGNPVSTLVCLTRYVIPAMLRSLGQTAAPTPVQLAEPISFAPDLCWFLPVTLDYCASGVVALPRPTNTSGDFVGLRGTDGFVELPRGQSEFAAGYSANFWPW